MDNDPKRRPRKKRTAPLATPMPAGETPGYTPEELIILRTAAIGVSQHELAAAVGLNQWQYGRYELGDELCPPEIVATVRWLAGEGPKPPHLPADATRESILPPHEGTRLYLSGRTEPKATKNNSYTIKRKA